MKLRRNDKDSMFRMLYLDKKELLNLYNAVNGTDYTDVEKLEINTLQNAIYMNMKNDVSFLFNPHAYRKQCLRYCSNRK